MSDPIDLSIVIPAYNEQHRLPSTVVNVISYCRAKYGTEFEVLVVNDGSTDATVSCLTALQDAGGCLRVLSHPTNRGKGAAVKTGIMAAVGSVILFLDADGATPIDDEARLREAIENGADVAIGSRAIASCSVQRRRRWDRRLAAAIFHGVVQFYVDIAARDSQCGFKMFRRETAQTLFSLCDEDGYVFDIMVLRLASRLGLRIVEVAVNWNDVSGSKVNLVRDSARMLRRVRGIEARVNQALAHNTQTAMQLRKDR